MDELWLIDELLALKLDELPPRLSPLTKLLFYETCDLLWSGLLYIFELFVEVETAMLG